MSRPDAAGISLSIAAESERWSTVADVEAVVRRAILAAVTQAGVALRPGADVSVLLTDDAEVRALNRTWRRQDKATNVLSFPASSVADLGQARMLGDIVVAFETVEREALADGKTIEAHLTHLAVHGFLHLLGHDHLDDAEAERMEALERAILAALGLDDPYADKP